MRRLEVGAGTDVGQVRPRNEDAYHAGEGVFAVADGMGGHLAGDVAAATALGPVKSLDGRVFPDAPTAQGELLDAILAANAAVVRKAASEPTLHGMGTTLTATIVEGRRLHVGHVGDSRAYLIRDGALSQLTRDHTLVAHLVEEGRITREEAAVHPQRSIVTRAIGVDVEVDVDSLTIDLRDGDQILLCSDGLTGPVGDRAILDVVTREDRSAQDAVDELIALANRNGGPDNITVVLLRYHDDDPAPAAAAAATQPPTVIRPDADRLADGGDDIRTLARWGVLGGRLRRPPDREPSSGRAARIVTAVAVVIGLLLLAAVAAWWLLSRSYFVGLADDEQVAIFHGVPSDAGFVPLSWVAEETDLTADDLPGWKLPDVREGIAAANREDARRIVETLRELAAEGTDGGASDGATAEPSPEATASPTGSPASP